MKTNAIAVITAALLLAVSPIFAGGCKAGTHAAPSDAGSMSGAWSGYTQLGAEKLKIRFDVIDAGGRLSGKVWLEDPESHELLPGGTLDGEAHGNSVSWTTTGGAALEGTMDKSIVKGTIMFSGVGDRPSTKATIELSAEKP